MKSLYSSVAAVALLAGCAHTVEPQQLSAAPMNIPPSLMQTAVVEEPAPPASINGKGITKGVATIFHYDEDQEVTVRVCSGKKATNIVLRPGEKITGKTPAAEFGDADTARWAGPLATMSGNRLMVSLSATGAGQRSSMTIATNERDYMFDLVSVGRACMRKVQFTYDEDRPRKTAIARSQPFNPSLAYRGFRISLDKGTQPAWFPVNVFEYLGKTYIELPGAPGAIGTPAVLVNGSPATPRIGIGSNFLELDQAISAAELRQGGSIVKIERAS